GAPAAPERESAIISQNGNAYEEGLSKAWGPFQRYWREPTPTNREALREFLTPTSVRWQYTHGVSDPARVSPDGSALDSYYLARPGADEAQLDLFLDYASNVALYPEFQAYFRKGACAAAPGGGEELPFLSARRCRGLQARPPERRDSPLGYRSFRARDPRRRDRRRDRAVHAQVRRASDNAKSVLVLVRAKAL